MSAVNRHKAQPQKKTCWMIFCLGKYSLAQSEDEGSTSSKTATTVRYSALWLQKLGKCKRGVRWISLARNFDRVAKLSPELYLIHNFITQKSTFWIFTVAKIVNIIQDHFVPLKPRFITIIQQQVSSLSNKNNVTRSQTNHKTLGGWQTDNSPVSRHWFVWSKMTSFVNLLY